MDCYQRALYHHHNFSRSQQKEQGHKRQLQHALPFWRRPWQFYRKFSLDSASENKKSPANANGNVQQRCMFESPVKQSLSQSSEGARRPVAIAFYSYSPKGVIYLAQPTPYRLKIANFFHLLSFIALFRGVHFRIYGKALLILKLECSRQATVTIW